MMTRPGEAMGAAISRASAALDSYQLAYARHYEGPIANDYVLGEGWRDAMEGLRSLLNGDLGPYDGGTLDHEMCRVMKEAGFDV